MYVVYMYSVYMYSVYMYIVYMYTYHICSIAFIVGVLVYLYFGPPECLDVNGDMEGVPPFLYGSLFSVIFVLSLSILNENIIFSISIKGNILDTKNKRKYILFWLSLRIGLIVFETLDIIICTFAVFGPAPYAAGALVCPEYHNGPLVYAKVVMVVMLTTQLIYVVGFFVFVDPLGLCCSPSILPDMHRVEGYGSKTYQEVENEEKSYPKNSRLGHLHRSHVGYGKVLKKVKSIMCCLNANGNRSRQTAMQEMALALHTLFSDDDRVPSDLVAGLMLVSRYQKAKSGDCNSCSGKGIKCSCLFRGLKKVRLLLLCLMEGCEEGWERRRLGQGREVWPRKGGGKYVKGKKSCKDWVD